MTINQAEHDEKACSCWHGEHHELAAIVDVFGIALLLTDLADFDHDSERCTPEYLERMALEARAILARIEGGGK